MRTRLDGPANHEVAMLHDDLQPGIIFVATPAAGKGIAPGPALQATRTRSEGGAAPARGAIIDREGQPSAGGRRPIAGAWGATAAECVAPYPCDHLLPAGDVAHFRAVDVRAPAPLLFRWLCQLRVAPYSYDCLDNVGRRSPRRLGRGLDELAPGQRVMTIFRLVAFERDRHLTMVLATPRAIALFGELALSYVVVPRSEDTCRLVVKLLACELVDGERARPSFPPRLPPWLLAWGDLVMMRKQLLTLKGLAEAGYARARLNEAHGLRV